MLLSLKHNENGQATVEAAVMIPVIFLILLLMIEPGILLYDWIVMNHAAASTCRVLSTSTDDMNMVENFARRRLEAIPQQDNFHVHDGTCSYEISFEGKDTVNIKNEVKPLPIIGFLSGVLGILNGNNNFELNVKSTQHLKPSWVKNSDMANWVGSWLK